MEEKWGRKMRRRTKIAALTVVALAVAYTLGYAWWQHQYPYGWSHCCDIGLYFDLQSYAATHGGAFPAGEATPEASLSLLYRSQLSDANLLRGKTVPTSVVQEILERGDLLTPETCGWHYVEGLRIDDDPGLALFWDKAGLDHNGGRLEGGGHIVTAVTGDKRQIPESEWNEFIEEQNNLLAERKTAVPTVRIDNDEVKVRIRVVGDGIYGSAWSSGQTLRQRIATLEKQQLGTAIQGLPVIPSEEIKSAKVVVEQDKARVRFVLQGREIVYDGSGFHVVAAVSRPTKK
jgi:hypothetical protein